MLEDLHSGFRQIGRNPGFSAAVILTLALGVGAPTAVFTLADPLSFALSAGLVTSLVTGAGFVPAWRASRTNPTTVLRAE